MEIVALGHNHDTASIELREKFAFSSNELKSALSRLRTRTGIIESAIISTCNRNEIYGVVPNQEALSDLIDFFHDFHCIDRGIAGQSLYTLERENAVRHLFSVASGIDSMVVGETQIANQLNRHTMRPENRPTPDQFSIDFLYRRLRPAGRSGASPR